MSNRRSLTPGLAVALMVGVAVVLAFGPLVLPPFYVRVGQLMLYSAGLGVAWAILGGFAGYASFGHAAFIGVGAFAAGLVEERFSGLPTPLLLPLGLAHVRGMLAVDPSSEKLGDAQPVVDRRARELLAVPGVGLREAVRPMADWVDEARHPTPIISGLRSWDQRACGRRV